jgi:hypothetical protein
LYFSRQAPSQPSWGLTAPCKVLGPALGAVMVLEGRVGTEIHKGTAEAVRAEGQQVRGVGSGEEASLSQVQSHWASGGPALLESTHLPATVHRATPEPRDHSCIICLLECSLLTWW